MKTIIALAFAFALSLGSASAQTKPTLVPAPTSAPAANNVQPAPPKATAVARPTFVSVKACLEKICVQFKGQTACLTEGSHFRPASTTVAGPTDFSTRVVELVQGLKTHPVWQAAAPAVDVCMVGIKKY